jgi:hypothetical protein
MRSNSFTMRTAAGGVLAIDLAGANRDTDVEDAVTDLPEGSRGRDLRKNGGRA